MQYKRASWLQRKAWAKKGWAVDLLFGEATKGPARCGDRTAFRDLSEDFARALLGSVLRVAVLGWPVTSKSLTVLCRNQARVFKRRVPVCKLAACLCGESPNVDASSTEFAKWRVAGVQHCLY